MADHWREIPPTAGLPLRWRDFLPFSAALSLEAGLASLLDVPSVQIECSGTAALIVTLTALKRASGRRSVVIPAYTCPLVALAVIHCGLKPGLCDLRENSFDVCPQALERATNDDTLAVIATHLGGCVADLATVIAIARRKGAFVIEDAAQALGATWQGQPVGTIGDAGFSSLAAGKGLTLYEGGVLVARDAALRQSLHDTSAQIAPDRPSWEIRRFLELVAYAVLYRPISLKLIYGVPLQRAVSTGNLVAAVRDDFSVDIPLHRVGTLRRAVGAHALSRLPSFLETLSERAMERKRRLRTIPGLTVMDDAEGGRGTWPFLMVLMPTPEARDAALSRLWTSGLGVSRLFIYALPDYPYLSARLEEPDVPNARDFAARMLTISNSHWMRDADFLRICSVLSEVLASGI